MEFLKNCNQCQIRFSPKRSDQKFCSLKCKNRQNNKKVMAEYHQRKREDVVTKETHTVLIRNRNLLKANCDKQILIDSLEKVGFVLNTCTRFEQPKDSESPLLFCYDFGYQFIDAKTVRTFKRVQ